MRPVTFGNYLLLERISVGGMAELFRARGHKTDEVVAIKRILPEMAKDRTFVQMFADEGRICGTLDHPGIARIYDLGEVEGEPYLALEYVSGVDLLRLLNRLKKRGQRFSPELLAFIGAEIAEALDYAHQRRDAEGRPLEIIHRDISPQNVMASFAGELKIIDFGIAKARERSAETRAGVLKGKFCYMSPEQGRGQPLDHRSDIFAVGIVLWELWVGARLFDGKNEFEIIEQVRGAIVPPPATRGRPAPPEFEQIMLRALARRPEDRYARAKDLADALRGFVRQQPRPAGSRELATLVQAAFGLEFRREQKALDRLRRLSLDDLLAGPTTSDELLPTITEHPDPDQATQLSEPKAWGAGGSRPGPPPPPLPPPDSLPSENNLPSQPTQLLDDPDAARRAVAAQSTRILDEAPGGSAPPAAAPENLSAEHAYITGPPLPGGEEGDEEAGTRRRTLREDELQPARGFPWSAVAIALLVAGVTALGGVLLLRDRQAPPSGTLVVAVPSTQRAEVLVDGRPSGRSVAGRPLILRGVTPGTHRVVVMVGGSPTAVMVDLRAGEVRLVSPASPPGQR
jgi:serine/threonine protein kinase